MKPNRWLEESVPISPFTRFKGFNSMLSQDKNSLSDTIIKMIQRMVFHCGHFIIPFILIAIRF
jgi:hypothetical protein